MLDCLKFQCLTQIRSRPLPGRIRPCSKNGSAIVLSTAVLLSGIHQGAPAGVGTGPGGRPLPLPQQLPRQIQVRALQTLTDSDTRCPRSIKSHGILNVCVIMVQ
jgi:hypothetical protein